MVDRFVLMEHRAMEQGVLVGGDGTVPAVRRDETVPYPASLLRGEVWLAAGRRHVPAAGSQPGLEKVDLLFLRVIELAVGHAGTGRSWAGRRLCGSPSRYPCCPCVPVRRRAPRSRFPCCRGRGGMPRADGDHGLLRFREELRHDFRKLEDAGRPVPDGGLRDARRNAPWPIYTRRE